MAIPYKKTERDHLYYLDQHQASEFTRHVGDLCARREIDIAQLADRLQIEPVELLKVMNGRVVPSDLLLSGLSVALDIDVSDLKALAEESKLEIE